ncbi:FBP1 protein, partial [Onychorhynchus coronatus]|nr:FBP1 protein [Onychorhynchus coronatus]
GPFCEKPGDPCESQPCLNEGICQYNQSGYVCACPSGFLGHNCGIDINECSSRPCQNGGTCIDLPNSSKIHLCICSCTPGFTGKNCEEVIDYCSLLSISCLNEGLCLNIIGGFTVRLFFFSISGEFCEVQIDNCGSNSCENGGTCIAYEDHFQCTCPVGFEGERCELDIDACLFNNISCAPGALCFYDEENQRFHCVCVLGWTGKTCLENINECEENQCQHGATCEDGINKYSCNCVPGYEGPFCEVEINECLSSPCKNGATCMDLSGHFSCRCTAGFKGKFCLLK